MSIFQASVDHSLTAIEPLQTKERFKQITNWHAWAIHPPNAPVRPLFSLEVPSYGIVFMNAPEDARAHAQLHRIEPQYDHLLSGTFHVWLPPGVDSVKYKSIKVGFRAAAKFDLGPGRNGEEDEIFKREVSHCPSDGEGLLTQTPLRFDFSLIIPSTTAPRDWCAKGDVSNLLYAEVEGRPVDTLRAESPPRSPGWRNESGHVSRSPSPESRGLFSIATKPFKLVESSSIPQPPVYSHESRSTQTREQEVEWLKGIHTAQRIIRIQYNPDPNGGVNILDERATGTVKDLGEYNIRVWSDVWTISAMLQATLILPELPPALSVFSFKVSLRQTQEIFSPRDAPGMGSTKMVIIFPMLEEGVTPKGSHVFPAVNTPALWRGKAAGGKDEGALVVECQGRVLENDSVTRPSTLASVVTPLRVSHVLETHVYFSVHGTDAKGIPLHRGRPGELRVLKWSRGILLPGCTIVPAAVRLPDYEHPEEVRIGNNPEKPWAVCACSMSMAEIEDRMRAYALLQGDMELQSAKSNSKGEST